MAARDVEPEDQPVRRRWSAGAIRRDPFGFAAFAADEHRALADLLERIADDLPHAAPAAALTAAARLRRAAGVAADRDALLLAALEDRAPLGCAARAAATLARRDLAQACGGALELAEALDEFARKGPRGGGDALGYLLRACFEAIRRRQDWMEGVLLPEARERLTPEAAAALGARWAESAVAEGPLARSGFGVVEGARAW